MNNKKSNESLVQRIQRISTMYPDSIAQLAKDETGSFQKTTFTEFFAHIIKSAYFLKHKCKVVKNDHIGFICDNRSEWVIFDLGLQALSVANVPRGTDTNIDEIAYVLRHSNSVGCIFENIDIYNVLMAHDPGVVKNFKFIFFIQENKSSKKNMVKLPKNSYFYKDIIEQTLSDAEIKEIKTDIAHTSPHDLATLIYTSGTTSQPKGVCLTQQAFEVQIDKIIPKYMPIIPGEVFLSILPVWHAYAREILYIVLGSGVTVAYSKPIGKILLEDIIKVKAHYMTSVPRIWEGVYSAIHKKVRGSSPVRKSIFTLAVQIGKIHSYLGYMLKGCIPDYKPRIKVLDYAIALIPYIFLIPLRELLDILVFRKIRSLLGSDFKAGISGGGALPSHIDNFFGAAKIKIIEGYGLTEIGPVISLRNYKNPEINSVGKILPRIESRILDNEGKECAPGKQGVLYVKSDQTMIGYYKNEEATKAVLDNEGWLNTGDLVVKSHNGCIKILGRAKDTLVLSSGENVEPGHVEETLKKSDFIEQIVVVGQNKKTIAALIVPNTEELANYAHANGLINTPLSSSHSMETIEELCATSKIIALFRHEIEKNSHMLNAYEKVYKFVLLPNEFIVGEEMTQTLKIRRNVIHKKYSKKIEECYR